jgi:hypothetical protein
MRQLNNNVLCYFLIVLAIFGCSKTNEKLSIEEKLVNQAQYNYYEVAKFVRIEEKLYVDFVKKINFNNGCDK